MMLAGSPLILCFVAPLLSSDVRFHASVPGARHQWPQSHLVRAARATAPVPTGQWLAHTLQRRRQSVLRHSIVAPLPAAPLPRESSVVPSRCSLRRLPRPVRATTLLSI